MTIGVKIFALGNVLSAEYLNFTASSLSGVIVAAISPDSTLSDLYHVRSMSVIIEVVRTVNCLVVKSNCGAVSNLSL